MELLRLKELLKEKNITGKDLAQSLGVTPNTISRIAQGATFPSGDMLKRIADELDVDIRELFIPTKESTREVVYIKRGETYVNVGEIDFKPREGLK